MSLIRNVNTTAQDSPSIDAFGRWRVSSPVTLFDSKQIHNNQSLLWDDAEPTGSSTTSAWSQFEAATTIGVGATTFGQRVRQTYQRFNYQPGKSQLILLTFSEFDTATGITKRVGAFDQDNGIFLESAEGTINIVRRTKVSGSVVDNQIAQASWNLDTMDGDNDSQNPSGINLDFTKAQILFIDFEWLGVGRVRVGFVIDGLIYYCHEFLNANNLTTVYMSTPNLPLRYEINNDSNGAADEFVHICASVMSEGGVEETGLLLSDSSGAVANLSSATDYALLGIRQKAANLDGVVFPKTVSLICSTANDEAEWILYLNPTIAGSFTYSDYSPTASSVVQVAKGANTNTISAGIPLSRGFFATAAPDLAVLDAVNKIGSKIDGTRDEIVLAVRPITNNITVYGTMTWREQS